MLSVDTAEEKCLLMVFSAVSIVFIMRSCFTMRCQFPCRSAVWKDGPYIF